MTKKKILVLSDHPLSPSGVGTQTKYFIEALLQTGRYKFICLGGAIKHEDYRPAKVDPWGDDWIIYPTDGYGSDEIIRSVLQKEKPDVLWFMTDPRFYGWLWEIENEIRLNVPMIYYHVWDNFPSPSYNGQFYRSTDKVVAISKVTHQILKNTAPDVETEYLPHAVDPNHFRLIKDSESLEAVTAIKDRLLNSCPPKTYNKNKKIFFWNNRNARRKQSGTLIWWFKEFLDKVGHDKACLLMHTDARDPHGQDLPHIIEHLGVNDGQVFLSTAKVPPEELANMYNASDFTINISDAEGFGLSTLESLSCGTPIIVNMTGGLQEQVTNGTEWFGVGLTPTSKAIIGSQDVPYIYEDYVDNKNVAKGIKKLYDMTRDKKAKKALSDKVLNYATTQFAYQDTIDAWHESMIEAIKEFPNKKRWSRETK